MGTEQESSSLKMSGPEKIFVSLPTELGHILTVLVLSAVCVILCRPVTGDISVSFMNTCVWAGAGYALLYSVLKYIFLMFAGRKASVLAVSVSAALLAVLLRDRETEVISAGVLALIVYVLWLVVQLMSDKLYPGAILCLFADCVMTYSYLSGLIVNDFTGKIIYSSLFVLTLYNLRLLIGSGKESRYPFAGFIVLLLFLMLMPVREDPINWEPVLDAGRRVADKTRDILWSVSYYLDDLIYDSGYYTGYTNLVQNGDSIHSSDKTEIELKTRDNTTISYKDKDSGKKMKLRRTVYLAGGRMPDHDQLFDILFSLYSHGVDAGEASLYLRNTQIDITYVYLKTADEIMPPGLLSLTDNKGNVISESTGRKHKKGYGLKARYLDMDYGSPYLANIISSPLNSIKKSSVSYKKMSVYAYETFGIRLNELTDEDEYTAWQNTGKVSGEYLDTSGATDRMRRLAHDITAGCTDDYGKCKAVEAYLRQYKYSRNTGILGLGNTGSAEGLGRIADNFLFESGKGYCVHYASSMVMLLRLNGIPARYTSGYRYTFPFERQEIYKVSAANAHAWPEAYIKGYGWVPYEPTTGISTAEDRTWHRQPEALAAGSTGRRDIVTGNVPSPVPAKMPEELPADKETDRSGEIKDVVRIAFIIISAVVLMMILMMTGARVYKAVRYRMADPKKRLFLDVADITGIIRSVSDISFDDRGIMSDYERYIPEKYRDEVRSAFEIYNRIKYRCRYSAANCEEVTVWEENRVRLLRNNMYHEYKRKALRR